MVANAVNQAGNMPSRLLSPEEIDELYNKLFPFTQASEELKLQHIQKIKTNHSTSQLSNEKVSIHSNVLENESVFRTCPKCSAPLVLRTAKKGSHTGQQFYGCANYPKCRYIL